ncbi:hypothetical protein [Glacieibacterium frigidum]|uniref:Uncharacterized protein n=1 Tax=Glacieibacterium frigidum TaxID=2593303 RepID=A0A552U820_9SPHN|nr:hypothetical protein [Glacieibacterium frigidum]TRW14368.1 hypothetical protein FMM06_11695 [Glacieibacterium frigidum]
MTITAASVEANGWVLRLTVTGTPGSFATYALDPDGSPRVALACVHPGFAPSGGTVASNPSARTLVATKPLRKPVNPASPTTPVIDETDNGNGTVTVRLALSEFVHATETSVACTVLAGWRSGAAAQAGIAVTNNSTFVAAVPIFRWARLGYRRETGAFDVELVAFSHHPQGVAPVAGVKFTVTDGTTVKTAWATALSTSTAYGDALRCYRVTIDPATATALTAGLLRCDAEVYPWLGAMRSTDPAGTRSMTGLATAGYGDSAQRPHVVGYDPAGTRYAGQYLFVDPAGTTTASLAMVQPSHAAAKALALGSRPANITTAIQALYLANRTLTAANGGASALRATDGAMIRLAAGTHVPGSTTVSFGLTSSELPVVVEGDPDDADPRANCILRTQASAPIARVTRLNYRNLRLEIGGTALFGSGTAYCTLENVEVRGKAGSEGSAVTAFLGAVAGQLPLNAVRSRWWRSGSRFGGSTQLIGLLRNCEWSRTADAAAVLGGRFIPATEDSTATGVIAGVGGQAVVTQGNSEDVVITGVDLRSVKGRAWTTVAVPAAMAGTPNPSYRRLAFVNNLCERIGTDQQPFFSFGEEILATMSYNIVEGNSFAGERCNLFYSDPPVTSVADTNTVLNQAFGNRVANNVFDWAPTKHDAFNDPQTATMRGTPNGYRPHMVDTWSITYGVGFEANVDFGRHASAGNFAFEYMGVRSVQTVGAAANWPDDRSAYGTGTGGGTYRPAATSLTAGRARRANVDRDRTGAVRGTTFASGANDVPAVVAVALAPAGALSASGSGSPLIAWAGELGPYGARSLQLATSPATFWSAELMPAPSMLASLAGSPLLTLETVMLAPASASHGTRDFGAAVLPDLVFATARLMRISGEVRVQVVEPDRLLLVC